MEDKRNASAVKGITRWSQIKIYVGKLFRLFISERGWKVLIFAAIIALLVSSMIWDSMFVFTMETSRGIFSLVSACTWIGIFNSIQSICKERGIIKREHRSGLYMSAYIIAHLIYEAVICFLQAIILMGCSMIFMKYPADTAFFGNIWLEYFITWFLIIYAADVLGIAISSIVKTPATAMTVMPFVLIFQLMLSGFLFSPAGIGSLFSKATVTNWGMRAGLISAGYNEIDNTETVRLTNSLHKIVLDNEIDLQRDVIDAAVREYYHPTLDSSYDHNWHNLVLNWTALIIHTVVYALLAIFSLQFIDRDKR